MSTRTQTTQTGPIGSVGTDGGSFSPSGGDLAPQARLEPAHDGEVVADDAPVWSDLIDQKTLDDTIDKIMAAGGPAALTGRGGFLPGLVKAVLERGLQAELSDHLGYDKGDPAGAGSGNNRNGATTKTVRSEVGPVRLAVPRDRNATFTPRLVAKGQRDVGSLSDMIVALYAGGMTVRDIERYLQTTLGVQVSAGTISNITNAVLDEVAAWQTRPLDPIWPVVYVDALVVKIRDGNVVTNKAAHLVVGVDLDGVKHVLGIWIQNNEGAKFWAQVFTELRNRGVKDVLIACCDGLEGLPEAIEAIWPRTVTQTCVVHLIRASMRFVSYGDRKEVAKALRPIYAAPTAEAAETALLAFADSALGRRYAGTVGVWERAWDRFIPFLAFPPEVRKIIYTTNAIESLNYQIRKIIKNRGHFPSDDAAIKLIWLAICDIEDKRAWQRSKEAGKPRNQRLAPGRMIEGQTTQGWRQALNALSIAYPDRIPNHAL
jgi:putative transposase